MRIFDLAELTELTQLARPAGPTELSDSAGLVTREGGDEVDGGVLALEMARLAGLSSEVPATGVPTTLVVGAADAAALVGEDPSGARESLAAALATRLDPGSMWVVRPSPVRSGILAPGQGPPRVISHLGVAPDDTLEKVRLRTLGTVLGGVAPETLREIDDLAFRLAPDEGRGPRADITAVVLRRYRETIGSDPVAAPLVDAPVAEQVAAACAHVVASCPDPSAGRVGLVIQAMAVVAPESGGGHGTVFSRDPDDGTETVTVAFRAGPLGDTRPTADLPRVPLTGCDALTPMAGLLAGLAVALELELADMAEIDFVHTGDELALVGGRAARRSGRAALEVAVSLASDDRFGVSRREAVARITPAHLEQVLHPTLEREGLEVIARGLAASPGAASGVVVFDADSAVSLASGGTAVILVARETSPEDVHGMQAAAGILTSRGGLASHAAVVARGWGKPAVCGAAGIEIGDGYFTVEGRRVDSGEALSIDGSTGEVFIGEAATSEQGLPASFETVLSWADEIRGGALGIRANADTGEDAATAVALGAEGIGLCRTEHMFLSGERLGLMRQMILAETPGRERMALTRLRRAQRDDFLPVLEEMDGLPVTVRLLDPPLHEFLPDVEELSLAEARGELDAEGLKLLAAARSRREQNPMLGTRGVRLGWIKPGLYAMQVRALVEAVAERVRAGGDPRVEVMIPLTVSGPEMAGARRWVTEALDELGVEPGRVQVGTMIETPRAALVAGELAAVADFFSFGTNDLTQLTFGFSRDDVENSIMGVYLEEGLLDANPFDTLDSSGVGELLSLAVERGRRARPGMKIGVCGEHGGDPASISRFMELGVDYVSCSPYRVPVARLAVAQALLATEAAAG